MKVVCKVVLKNGEKSDYRAIRNADTQELIVIAVKRTIDDYINECLHGNNECAVLVEKYERKKDGKDAILWCDSETMEIFVSY